MAKKQTRRSISVSRSTYERLKAFCEANNISMSQFVEARVGESLGNEPVVAQPRPTAPPPDPTRPSSSQRAMQPAPQRPAAPVPMTAASARYAVEPPPPIIKPKNDAPAPAPVVKTADQIFTF